MIGAGILFLPDTEPEFMRALKTGCCLRCQRKSNCQRSPGGTGRHGGFSTWRKQSRRLEAGRSEISLDMGDSSGIITLVGNPLKTG
jgi:hypothetical protein